MLSSQNHGRQDHDNSRTCQPRLYQDASFIKSGPSVISQPTQVVGMKRNLVLSIVAIAALIAAATYLALNPSADGARSTTKSQATFTLVVSRTGYNRSEEHTSELQSLRHLVCRLLLEKKKKD